MDENNGTGDSETGSEIRPLLNYAALPRKIALRTGGVNWEPNPTPVSWAALSDPY
jgi:hypothetical protein